jgi:hypothetical protein
MKPGRQNTDTSRKPGRKEARKKCKRDAESGILREASQ